MVNPKELRIGNLILLETGFALGQIHVIKGQDIADLENGKITLSALSGITLTPEWLKRMGCTVQTFEGEDGALVDLEGIFQATPFYQWTNLLSISAAPKARRLKYVHELQNYILDLTGIELTIKETV